MPLLVSPRKQHAFVMPSADKLEWGIVLCIAFQQIYFEVPLSIQDITYWEFCYKRNDAGIPRSLVIFSNQKITDKVLFHKLEGCTSLYNHAYNLII